jgi:hypothetical protein
MEAQNDAIIVVKCITRKFLTAHPVEEMEKWGKHA